jgi:carbon-monoxide dehydrogenase medium subunit
VAAALDGVTVPAKDLMSDMHASADYRAHLVTVMAKRAVRQANGS